MSMRRFCAGTGYRWFFRQVIKHGPSDIIRRWGGSRELGADLKFSGVRGSPRNLWDEECGTQGIGVDGRQLRRVITHRAGDVRRPSSWRP